MTNQQVRQWYKEQVSHIPKLNEEWRSEGISLQERAMRAWQIRHDARLRARNLMEDTKEVNLLRARDLKSYGNPQGPTFQFLVEEAVRHGLKGDKIYESIILGSYKTNADINERFE